MKNLFAAVSLAALMAMPAVAQDSTTPSPSPAPAEQAAPPPAPAPEATAPAKPEAEAPAPAPDATAIPDKSAAAPSASGIEVSANDLINAKLVNKANETVGDINDLSLGSDGKIAAVIVGVGGFLGMGEKNVALPFEQLTISRDADGKVLVTADMTKESLQTAPEWKKP
jgi:hypothetical protein